MCTLILGFGVLGPRTVLVGADRDEDPARPSDPPRLLSREPRVTGGRDRRAGGTWLALRERRAVVAMLNRRPSPADLAREWPRSRGLLTLEVAAVPDLPAAPTDEPPPPIDVPPGLPRAALARAWSAVTRDAYAPFSLLFAAPAACWLVSRDSGQAPRARALAPGWHVLTHADVDDPREPRAASLVRDLARCAPRTRAEAVLAVLARLRRHAGPAGPAVCLHHGRMVTVSSSLLWLDGDEALHLHAEGRPCQTPYHDVTTIPADPDRGGT